jgi:hypothetical protein
MGWSLLVLGEAKNLDRPSDWKEEADVEVRSGMEKSRETAPVTVAGFVGWESGERWGGNPSIGGKEKLSV